MSDFFPVKVEASLETAVLGPYNTLGPRTVIFNHKGETLRQSCSKVFPAFCK